MTKTREYKLSDLSDSFTLKTTEQAKIERFDEMRKLVLKLAELHNAKKATDKHFNEQIKEVEDKLFSLASQNDSQLQLNLNGKEESERTKEGQD